MTIDPTVLDQLRATDTNEKAATRMRRYRDRLSANVDDPVTGKPLPRNASKSKNRPVGASGSSAMVLPDSAENSFPWECSWCDFIQPRLKGRNWYGRSLFKAESHLTKHPLTR